MNGMDSLSSDQFHLQSYIAQEKKNLALSLFCLKYVIWNLMCQFGQ